MILNVAMLKYEETVQYIYCKSCLKVLITKLLPESPCPVINIKSGLGTLFLKWFSRSLEAKFCFLFKFLISTKGMSDDGWTSDFMPFSN